MAEDNFRHLVRVANTDLDGNKIPEQALQKIKGVGLMFAHAITAVSGVNPTQKVGYFSDAEVEKMDAVLKEPLKHGIPTWMLNRQRDYETGENMHVVNNDLIFIKGNDIKRLQKLKNFKGSRHSAGLPLRGQRTKSNFRRNKNKGKGGLGVKRK